MKWKPMLRLSGGRWDLNTINWVRARPQKPETYAIKSQNPESAPPLLHSGMRSPEEALYKIKLSSQKEITSGRHTRSRGVGSRRRESGHVMLPGT